MARTQYWLNKISS